MSERGGSVLLLETKVQVSERGGSVLLLETERWFCLTPGDKVQVSE